MTPEADHNEYHARLLNPMWELVESHFGCSIPAVLKSFYSDPGKVLQGGFDLRTPVDVDGADRIHIEDFSIIDESSTEHFEGFERFLEIASDGGEGLYFIDPRESDPEVHLFIMDGWDLHPTGLRLGGFLSDPRLEGSDGLDG